MRNVFVLIGLLFVVSCNYTSSQRDNKKIEHLIQEKNQDVQVGSCQKFLDDYEAWVNEVIELYQNAKDDPLNIEYSRQLMTLSKEMNEWSDKWTKLYECRENEEYVSRMEVLQKKLDKEMM